MVFGFDDAAGIGIGLGTFIGNTISGNNASAKQVGQSMSLMDYQHEMQKIDRTESYKQNMFGLKEAGLNPLLAAGFGPSSTSPGLGSSSMPQTADAPFKGVSSAIDVMRMRREREQSDSQINLNQAMEAASKQDALLKANNARTAAANADQAEAQTAAVRARAKNDERREKYNSSYIDYDSQTDRAARSMGVINNAKNFLLK